MKSNKIIKKTHVHAAEVKIENQLFSKDNYLWMLIGVIVLALGFFLMAGGKSADINVFKDSDVYSFRRITLAPIVIIAGLVLEIYAIMKKPKNHLDILVTPALK